MNSKYIIKSCPKNIISEFDRYCYIYQNLILLKYNIFPVPDKLINNMVLFCLFNNSLNLKTYILSLIYKKYCKNWKYYHTFKYNLNRMLKKNLSSSITLIKFNSNQNLKIILKKYPPLYLNTGLNMNMNAVLYNYTLNFDLCLLVNDNLKTKFNYYKAIQHLLIHWMQVVLNAESHMSHGIFNNFLKSLTNENINFLYECFPHKFQHNTINYVLGLIEFLAWCANAVLNFLLLNLNLSEFNKIITNKLLFKSTCLLNSNNDYMQELLMFAQICYLASLINPADDRYWYLIESIKNN